LKELYLYYIFLPEQKKFKERFDEIDLFKYICLILKT